ncbi:MAG: DUF3472 domain-containing protein [Pirellulaceae bacterium]
MHIQSKVRIAFLGLFVVCVQLFSAGEVLSQDAAPSSHFVFDDNFAGDIVVNNVRVPKNGLATYTYYEALGWQGAAAGYAGIQAHPKAPNYIFSIWDNEKHTAPIKVVYQGAGTLVEGFGGEGTGLKSWNFELGWTTDVWYTLVARRWFVGDHTFFGYWVRAADSQKWEHLVTMDVAVAKVNFEGSTDAFIEDWIDSGANERTIHLGSGWKRKLDGSWFPFGSGNYSVNAWDLVRGKRSFDRRERWNGGVVNDSSESYYFMTSGGDTIKPQVANPSKHKLERATSEVRPDFEVTRIVALQVESTGEQTSLPNGNWTRLPRHNSRIRLN